MEEVLLCLCIIVMLIAVGALIVVLTIYIYDRKGNAQGEIRSQARTYGTDQGYSSQMIMRESETAYARVWEIQLWNQATNRLYRKRFTSQVMLGRFLPGTELFWQMRLDDDPTISREHCVIYDRGGFLIIENISTINPTRIDGKQIMTPILFQQGNMLTMGNSSYYVSSIRRMA